MTYFTWSLSRVATGILDLRPGFRPLLEKYGESSQVLQSVLGYAWRLGAETAIVEYRYIDQDYRSEHQAFYSGTFRRYPSVAERLLFFRGRPPDRLKDRWQPADFSDLDFVGYAVMRPLNNCPVGRAVLPPEERLSPYVSCKAVDEVHLFDKTLWGPNPLNRGPRLAGRDVIHRTPRRRLAPSHGLVERSSQRRLLGDGRPNDRDGARRWRVNGPLDADSRNDALCEGRRLDHVAR